jgi:hypothetical protein
MRHGPGRPDHIEWSVPGNLISDADITTAGVLRLRQHLVDLTGFGELWQASLLAGTDRQFRVLFCAHARIRALEPNQSMELMASRRHDLPFISLNRYPVAMLIDARRSSSCSR